MLSLYDREDGEPFTLGDAEALTAFAMQAAVAIENVQLHAEAERLSVTDPLTGAWNYRYFERRFEQEIERSRRFGRFLALLMLDIDHFKSVNDRFGHQRGDEVLVEFARRVTGSVRDIDTFARYGGEEFVLILPETNLEGGPARSRAGRLGSGRIYRLNSELGGIAIVKVRKAVIPAAGLGTRFLPATKAQPKEMLPLVDKPSIQYVIEEAVGAGIEDILIVTGRGKQAIEDHFDRSVELEQLLTDKGDEDKLELVRHISDMAQVHYIRQKAPLGLGHAVSMAEQHVGDEPFAVLLGDDVIEEGSKLLADLVTGFERHGSSVVAAMEVERSQIKAYGCVAPADEVEPGLFRMADIVEKPAPEEAPSTLAVIGRYVLHPEIFDALRATEPGAGNEIQVTDALRHLVQSSERGVLAYAFTGTRYDAGDKNDYLRATVELAARRDDIGPAFTAFLRRFVAELDRQAEARGPARH